MTEYSQIGELIKAAKTGDLAKIDELLKRGIDINLRKHTKTALHGAVRSNQLGVVRYLLNNKADVNPKDEDGFSPLHHAARFGFVNIARELINQGAVVNDGDSRRGTPLMVAANKKQHEMIRFLISRGGNPNYVHNNGWKRTALLEAMMDKRIETIIALLEYGADPYCEGAFEEAKEIGNEKALDVFNRFFEGKALSSAIDANDQSPEQLSF